MNSKKKKNNEKFHIRIFTSKIKKKRKKNLTMIMITSERWALIFYFHLFFWINLLLLLEPFFQSQLTINTQSSSSSCYTIDKFKLNFSSNVINMYSSRKLFETKKKFVTSFDNKLLLNEKLTTDGCVCVCVCRYSRSQTFEKKQDKFV